MRSSRPFSPSDYRYPGEHAILALTVLLVLTVIAVSAAATLCGSVLFVGAMVILAYFSTRARHAELVQRAQAVKAETAPQLWALVEAGAARLGAGPVAAFVTPSNVLNAYTFGLDSPKVVVLESALLQVMDADELAFIIAHELGHVRLGHTWLNSLVGGLAGIPSPASAFGLLQLAFLWWNRACEHSADRAGLLATGRPDKAISALVKLATGGQAQSPAQIQWALEQVESQSADAGAQIAEALATHPRLASRIAELRRYAASSAYQRLAASRA